MIVCVCTFEYLLYSLIYIAPRGIHALYTPWYVYLGRTKMDAHNCIKLVTLIILVRVYVLISIFILHLFAATLLQQQT